MASAQDFREFPPVFPIDRLTVVIFSVEKTYGEKLLSIDDSLQISGKPVKEACSQHYGTFAERMLVIWKELCTGESLPDFTTEKQTVAEFYETELDKLSKKPIHLCLFVTWTIRSAHCP